MKVDINTKMITLIGTPLSQSFAARMQNTGYEAAGLNMLYFYTEADKERLGDIVNGIRHMNFAGFAVTKPNKVRVLRYLDELDPLCQKMGASNTVVKTPEGKLILAYHGARKIYVTDLFEPCAKSLVSDINENFAPVAEFVHHGDFSKLAACNVILNASGIGMGEHIGESPLPKEYIQPSQFFFDACYNPERTQFLMDAEEKGCKVLNGLGMSLYQGAAQIELWTGKKPPVEAMRQELLKIVAEQQAAAK